MIDCIKYITPPNNYYLRTNSYKYKAEKYKAWVFNQANIVEEKFGPGSGSAFKNLMASKEYFLLFAVEGTKINTKLLEHLIHTVKVDKSKKFAKQPFVLSELFPLRETATAMAFAIKYSCQIDSFYVASGNEVIDKKQADIAKYTNAFVKELRNKQLSQLDPYYVLEEKWQDENPEDDLEKNISLFKSEISDRTKLIQLLLEKRNASPSPF